MNPRKLAYSLAVIMLSYDVLSTFIAAKLYGRFADLSPIYNFLWEWNPAYVPIRLIIAIAGLIFIFWVALLSIEGERLSERILVICCDFWAVYLLIFESVAIPHNTMVLFGAQWIVPSSEMYLIQEIVSAFIAGVIVVVVDWKKAEKVLEIGSMSNR